MYRIQSNKTNQVYSSLRPESRCCTTTRLFHDVPSNQRHAIAVGYLPTNFLRD
jgi:hypothetical protein